MKYILRIIIFPIVFLLIIFGAIRMILDFSYLHFRYGGEWIVYSKKRHPQTFQKIIDCIIK
jgi:hypothetical protein